MSNFVGSTTNTTKTGLIYIDSILWGNHWNIKNDGQKLTYSFINNQPWDNNFHSAEQTTFTSAINSWANVTNIRLEFSGYNDHNAEIIFHSVPGHVINGSLGMGIAPGHGFSHFIEGEIMINQNAYASNPIWNLKIGGYYYMTYVHEIGHALGLAHPHDNGGTSSVFPGFDSKIDDPLRDTATYGLNQYVWTAMSYVDKASSFSPGDYVNWGYIGGPMAFDIAAVQSLYGINTAYNTGDNTYNLPTLNDSGTYWSSIWDAGGIDTISGKNASNPVTINLNNASLADNDPNAGGYISQASGVKGGFTIANSQGGLNIIENAVGGSGNDILTGNEVANSLDGGFGQDILLGGDGDDWLFGWYGDDTLQGGNDTDVLFGENGKDMLTGGGGQDYFVIGSRFEGIDQITDFQTGLDKIVLMATDFSGGLTANNSLNSNQFHIGASANTTSQRVIYNSNDGALYFDQDGIGFMGQIQIATLDSGLAMMGNDIFVYG